jgi:hypothetical protein
MGSYGQIVHEQRLAAEAEAAAKEKRQRFNLGSWDERTPWQREVDERIGSAVAARAVHDAGVAVAEAHGRLRAVTVERDDALREVARLRAAIREHGGWPILPPRDSGEGDGS